MFLPSGEDSPHCWFTVLHHTHTPFEYAIYRMLVVCKDTREQAIGHVKRKQRGLAFSASQKKRQSVDA